MALTRKIFCIILFSLVVFPAPVKKKSFTLIIPGIKQIKSREYVKGIILAGSFFGFAIGAFLKNRDGYKYYDLYKAATDSDTAVYYRRKTEGSFKDRNFFMLGALGVWVVHILDIKFSDRKRASIGGGVEKGNLYLGFRLSF